MANIVPVRLCLAGSRVLARIAQAQVTLCHKVHNVFPWKKEWLVLGRNIFPQDTLHIDYFIQPFN